VQWIALLCADVFVPQFWPSFAPNALASIRLSAQSSYSTIQLGVREEQPPAEQGLQSDGRMSAAARAKLSQLMKQRWAQGKMKSNAKKKTA
jgi:hypothetical protein